MHRIFHCMPLLFMPLALSCAVATVDVDVYKGPLTNQRDVQTEQIVSMVVAARPLLVQLRDQIEWGGGNGRLKEPKYRDDYMPDDPANPIFKKPRAYRVNAILSLYGDRLDEDIAVLVNRAHEAVALYSQSYKTLVETGDQDKPLWDELITAMRPIPDDERGPGLRELEKGYRLMSNRASPFDPRTQFTQNIMRGHVLLFNSADDVIKQPIKNFDLLPFLYSSARKPNADLRDIDLQSEQIISSNVAYSKLAEADFVKGHAQILFPENAALQAKFVRRVTEVGTAYRDARNALSALLTDVLTLIVRLHEDEFPEATARTSGLVSYVLGILDTKRLLEAVLASNDAKLHAPQAVVQLRNDLESLEVPNKSKKLFDAYRSLRNNKNQRSQKFKPIETEIYNFLLNRFTSDPIGISGQLIQTDLFFKKLELPQDNSGSTQLIEEYWAPVARSYGLAVGPVQTHSEDRVAADWQANAHSLGTSGLLGGRLDIGLNKEIENFLQASAAQTSEHFGVAVIEDQRRRLMQSLLVFGEKVRTLANDEILLPSQGGTSNDDPSLTMDESEAQKPYLRLLQAIGNTIVIQVDELREQSEHDVRLRTNANSAASASSNAFGDNPSSFIDRMLADLDNRAKDLRQADPKAAEALMSTKAVIIAFRRAYPEVGYGDNESSQDIKMRLLFWMGQKKAKWKKHMPTTHEIEAGKQGADVTGSNTQFSRNLSSSDIAFDEKTLHEATEFVAKYDAVAPIVSRATLSDPSLSSKDLVDQLIDALTFEKIRATSESGADSPRVQHITDAIDQARSYRSGMIYLRPAAAFLKNSYPATSLQENPKLSWSNTLEQHAWRTGTPVLPSLIANNKDTEILSEIDKQFWQNINQVRVAGAGDTNYVMAKDDVGNWYIKAYSNDMGDIIKAAGGLATYAMGPAGGAGAMSTKINKLAAAAKKSKSSDSDGTADSTSSNTADLGLNTELANDKQAYLGASNADFQAIKDFAIAGENATDPKIKTLITNSWTNAGINSADVGTLSKALNSAYDNIIAGNIPSSLPGQDTGQGAAQTWGSGAAKSGVNIDFGPTFVKAFQALRDFHLTMKLRLTQLTGLTDPQSAPLASQVLSEVMETHLSSLIEQRRSTADRYATQLGVLSGLVSGTKSAPTTQQSSSIPVSKDSTATPSKKTTT